MTSDRSQRRARVHALVRLHGWNPTSFQILDGGYRYWFTRDAVVAYVDTGRALVTAGAPVCATDRLQEVSERFAQSAARHGRRVSFFGVHQRFSQQVSWPSVSIGELPHWDPGRWTETVAAVPSLREQLRRARAAGVMLEAMAPASLGPELTRGLSALRERWLGIHGLAPMSFLVQPAELGSAHRVWLARRRGQLVGFACASPIYGREGALLQELVREPRAPNGTSELLVDAVFRGAAADGLRYATLGLAPLSGALPAWLRISRRLGRPLFDFEGLRAFKEKLRPEGWEPVGLVAPRGGLQLAVLDALTAFAGGSLTSFLGATVRKRWLTPQPS